MTATVIAAGESVGNWNINPDGRPVDARQVDVRCLDEVIVPIHAVNHGTDSRQIIRRGDYERIARRTGAVPGGAVRQSRRGKARNTRHARNQAKQQHQGRYFPQQIFHYFHPPVIKYPAFRVHAAITLLSAIPIRSLLFQRCRRGRRAWSDTYPRRRPRLFECRRHAPWRSAL